MKKNLKKILALICVLSMVVNGFSTMIANATNNNVNTKLTFSNFGINDGSIGNYGTLQGTVPNGMTTWDGAQFSGKITIPNNAGFGDYDGLFMLLFGGVEGTENWNNLYGANNGINIFITKTLIYANCKYTGATTGDTTLFTKDELTTAGINHMGQEVQICTVFKHTDEGAVEVTVTITQGENTIEKTVTFAGAADKMSANFCIATAQNKENIAYASYVPEVNYTDLTFSNLGITDGTIKGYGNCVNGVLPEANPSWDKVRFQGEINIPTNAGTDDGSDVAQFYFGGQSGVGVYDANYRIAVFVQPGGISLRAKDSALSIDTNDVLFSKAELDAVGITHIGENIQITVSFEYDNGDVNVVVAVVQGEQNVEATQTIVGIANNMTTNFTLGTWQPNADVSYQSVVDDEEQGGSGDGSQGDNTGEEVVYTELTFSELGLADGTIKGYGNCVNGVLPAINTSWNKVEFQGEINVPTNAGTDDGSDVTQFYFGGQSGVGVYDANYRIAVFVQPGGISLRAKDSAASIDTNETLFTKAELSAAGITHIGEALKVSTSFEYVDDDVKVTVKVEQEGQSLEATRTIAGIADNMTTNFTLGTWQPNADVSYASVVSTESYSELTFSELGITDGTIKGYGNCVNGVLPATNPSWDKVSFQGEINIPTNAGTDDGSDVAQFYFGGQSGVGVYDANYRVAVFVQPGGISLRAKDSVASVDTNEMLFTKAELTEAGIIHIGEVLKVSTSFEYVDDDVKVTVKVEQDGQSIEATRTIAGIADNMTTNFTLGTWQLNADIIYASVSDNDGTGDDGSGDEGGNEDEEIVYNEITLSDVKIANQSFIGYGSRQGSLPTDIASWDDMAFTSFITIPQNENFDAGTDVAVLLFGGVKDTENWNNPYGADKGVSLHMSPAGLHLRCAYSNRGVAEEKYDNFITKAELEEAGIVYEETALEVRTAFHYRDNGDLKVTVTVTQNENSVTKSTVFEGASTYMTSNIAISVWQDKEAVTFTGTDVVEEEITSDDDTTYRELTFYDYGLNDSTITSNVLYRELTDSSIESYENVAFTGIVILEDGNGSVRLGCEYQTLEGLMLNYQNGAIQLSDTTQAARGILLSVPEGTHGMSFAGNQTKVRITFQYDVEDIILRLYLNDVFVGGTRVSDYTNYLSTALSIITGTELEFASVFDEVVPDEVEEFREVSFSTFRIKDADYKNNVFYGQPPSSMKTLDRVAFSGYLTLAEESCSLRIGCANQSINGLMLYYDKNGKQLVLSDQTGANNGTIFMVKESEYGSSLVEKEFKFRITFDYYGDNNVRIRLYINDQLYGAKTMRGFAQYLGNSITLLAGTHIGVRSTSGVEDFEKTPWEIFIESKVDFAYFGFTENWDKELDHSL